MNHPKLFNLRWLVRAIITIKKSDTININDVTIKINDGAMQMKWIFMTPKNHPKS